MRYTPCLNYTKLLIMISFKREHTQIRNVANNICELHLVRQLLSFGGVNITDHEQNPSRIATLYTDSIGLPRNLSSLPTLHASNRSLLLDKKTGIIPKITEAISTIFGITDCTTSSRFTKDTKNTIDPIDKFTLAINRVVDNLKKLLPELDKAIATTPLDEQNILLHTLRDTLTYVGYCIHKSADQNDEELISILTSYQLTAKNCFIIPTIYLKAFVKDQNTSYLMNAQKFYDTNILDGVQVSHIRKFMLDTKHDIHINQMEFYKLYNSKLYQKAYDDAALLEEINPQAREAFGRRADLTLIESKIFAHYQEFTTSTTKQIKSQFYPINATSDIERFNNDYLYNWALCIHYTGKKNASQIYQNIVETIKSEDAKEVDPQHTIVRKAALITLGLKHLLQIDFKMANKLADFSNTIIDPQKNPNSFELEYYKYLTYEKNKTQKSRQECLQILNANYEKIIQLGVEILSDSHAHKIIQHLNEMYCTSLALAYENNSKAIPYEVKMLAAKYLSRLDANKQIEYSKLLGIRIDDRSKTHDTKTHTKKANSHATTASTETNEWLVNATTLPKNTSAKKATAKKHSKQKSEEPQNTPPEPDNKDAFATSEASSKVTEATASKTTIAKVTQKTSSASLDDDATSTSSEASADSNGIILYKIKLPTHIQDFVMMVDSGTINFDCFNSHHNLIPKLQNAYYQYKNSQRINEQYEDVVNYSTSWKIEGKEYRSEDDSVYKLNSMHHCYATISSDLHYDDMTIANKFKEAIAQSRIARSEGQSGIKIFDNIVELKINDSDSRLIAKAYQNIKGGILFVFDEAKNHKEIKRLVDVKSGLKLNPCDMLDAINYPPSEHFPKDLDNAQKYYFQTLGEGLIDFDIDIML